MKKRILIAVKTYPSLSETYNELVCTAGFLDDGSWIRIYPIPFRFLNWEQQYKKYNYIEIEVVRNTKDHRVESYRPVNITESLKIVGKIGTANNWAERKKIVLKNATDDFAELIRKAKEEHTSLAVYRPTTIVDFVWECVDREWSKQKLDAIKANLAQLDLFDEQKSIDRLFKVAKKLPYKFSYIFIDNEGNKHKLMIEDWELGALFWKCIKNKLTEEEACHKVKDKFFGWITKRDLYFILGTTLAHSQSNSPYIIIGVFYPPNKSLRELSLFD